MTERAFDAIYRTRRTRRDRVCLECLGRIARGETYETVTSFWDGHVRRSARHVDCGELLDAFVKRVRADWTPLEWHDWIENHGWDGIARFLTDSDDFGELAAWRDWMADRRETWPGAVGRALPHFDDLLAEDEA